MSSAGWTARARMAKTPSRLMGMGSSRSGDVIHTIAGDSSGGAKFYGFTDAGKSISSVNLTMSGALTTDVFSVDDLRFTIVPEPGTLALVLMATLLGMPLVRQVSENGTA